MQVGFLGAPDLAAGCGGDRYVIDVEKALSSGGAPKRHFGMAPPPSAHESVSVRGHGEGSRGGIVIGHTKTMKPVYQDSSHSSHATFSSADHNDAVEAHKAKIWEAIRKRDSETTPEGRAYHASKIEYHKGARDYHRGRAERAKGELQ
jgi:hypothetical protein